MDPTKAEERKKQGNEEHKKGNYVAAIRLFTEAIGIYLSSLNLLYSFEPPGALLLHEPSDDGHHDEGFLKSHR